MYKRQAPSSWPPRNPVSGEEADAPPCKTGPALALSLIHISLGLRFYPLLLYITARAINANREFRMGFNEHGAPGYWDVINPSYTIFHDDDKTFSDVWSEYDESFPVFYQNVLHDMETYKDIKGVRACLLYTSRCV